MWSTTKLMLLSLPIQQTDGDIHVRLQVFQFAEFPPPSESNTNVDPGLCSFGHSPSFPLFTPLTSFFGLFSAIATAHIVSLSYANCARYANYDSPSPLCLICAWVWSPPGRGGVYFVLVTRPEPQYLPAEILSQGCILRPDFFSTCCQWGHLVDGEEKYGDFDK